jgi:DNA polymerase-3 subunit alpha
MTKNILTFDTETTGIPEKGLTYAKDYNKFPYIVQLSWLFNGKMNNYIIKPDGYEIPEEATKIHGISTERALKEGADIYGVLLKFLLDCELSEKIIGHNIYFDTSIIKANLRRLMISNESILKSDDILHKSKRIDTMMKTIKFCGIKQNNSNRLKFPSLIELHQRLFNEGFNAHNAEDDVNATFRCYEELVRIGVIK